MHLPTLPTLPSIAAGVSEGVPFRCLFEGLPIAVLLLDEQGLVVQANPALQTQFGHDPQALRGQPLSMLVPDWDQPEALAELALRAQPHDATWRHASGRRCDVAVTLLRVPEAAAGCAYVLLGRDVSSQRRLERQMQVQATILARTQVAVVVLDEVAEVVCWNAGATRLYGPGAKDMVGQPFAPLFAPADHARLEQALADARCGAEQATEVQLRCTAPQRQASALRLSLCRLAGIDRGSELWMVQAWAARTAPAVAAAAPQTSEEPT